MALYNIINYFKKIFFILLLNILLFTTSNAMYNGSPNWHPPKELICRGIPEFSDKGLKIYTNAEKVIGMSLDYYIFTELNGIFGIFYFQLKMQDPPDSKYLEGIVTKIDSTDWSHQEFKVNCTVIKWHY